MNYVNPYPTDSWQARMESFIQVGQGELLDPMPNIRDLAKVVGKARAGDGVKLSIEVEQLWAYASLMTHNLLWFKKIPFGFDLLLDHVATSYPDITTPMATLNVIGISKLEPDLTVAVSSVVKSSADYYIFFRGTRYWLYPRIEIMTWPQKDWGELGAHYFKPISEANMEDRFGERPEPEPDQEFSSQEDMAKAAAEKRTKEEAEIRARTILIDSVVPEQENCELFIV